MSLPYPAAPAQSASRGVLSIPAFRKLWQAMAFSSFGDWLGLLASTALAQQLAGGDYAKANFAIAGVFIVRLLPAVILGPFAGVVADRFDRRKLMVICDILRFALYLSIPIVIVYRGELGLNALTTTIPINSDYISKLFSHYAFGVS